MIGGLRADRLAPGTVLAGRYRIERELGRGGIAIVFRAQDEKLNVPVAVKLLVPVGFTLVALQGISEIINRAAALRGWTRFETHYERPVQ